MFLLGIEADRFVVRSVQTGQVVYISSVLEKALLFVQKKAI